MAVEDVCRASARALLAHQHESGAFAASPDFSQYGYCWLRDGAFIAAALGGVGEFDAARRFHRWCVGAIDGVAPLMAEALERQSYGKPVDQERMPPARFSLAGEFVTDDWPNFQIDGYGTWLWALGQHVERSAARLPAEWVGAVERTAEYLAAFRFEPCFDVWEENGRDVHTSTLACVASGLEAAGRLLGGRPFLDAAAEVRSRLSAEAHGLGYYPKSRSRREADASALWLSAPLGLVGADDPAMVATVARIEETLLLEGGVRRYAGDTYFGGGAWPVLTCSLGLHYLRAARADEARRCFDWTAARIDAAGRLGEQFFGERRDPDHYGQWVAQWGPPAADLLWSHAMAVLLGAELGGAPDGNGSEVAGFQ